MNIIKCCVNEDCPRYGIKSKGYKGQCVKCWCDIETFEVEQ